VKVDFWHSYGLFYIQVVSPLAFCLRICLDFPKERGRINLLHVWSDPRRYWTVMIMIGLLLDSAVASFEVGLVALLLGSTWRLDAAATERKVRVMRIQSSREPWILFYAPAHPPPGDIEAHSGEEKLKSFLIFLTFQVPNDGSSLLLLPGGILLAGGICNGGLLQPSPPELQTQNEMTLKKAQKLIRGYNHA